MLLNRIPLILVASLLFSYGAVHADTPKMGKDLPNNSQVSLNGVSVTAVFSSQGCVYVEFPNKTLGIRVDTSVTLAEGKVVNVSGKVQTDSASGERYIASDPQFPHATGATATIGSVGLNAPAVGGGPIGLQGGVSGGVGLNNIGLLVRIVGVVTQIDPLGAYYYVDDGSRLSDGTTTNGAANVGVRVVTAGKTPEQGQTICVTGISSCFKTGSTLRRLIRTRSVADTKAFKPDLGANASLNGCRPFPNDNPWNTPIDAEPVDPNSNTLINSIGPTIKLHPDFGADYGGPFGIPYIVVSGSTARVPVSFDYADESDPGPYPIPPNAPIEGGPNSDGDRHILVVDRDNWKLYELYYAFPQGSGYHAGSGAVFDLKSDALRPAGWTSADAAGLPIFPGLVRYDEVVEQKEIKHALRFTVSTTRKGYIYPARHFASSNTSSSLPPMGMRVRLKSSFDTSSFPSSAKVILDALKKYGMILADNGSNWYISGAPDARWNDTELNTLKTVAGSNFEVVKMGTIVTH